MHDEKRFIRTLRRQMKLAGNRKRRRYLKQLDAEPGDFTFGRSRVSLLDDLYPEAKRPRSKQRRPRTEQ